jgi:hypothetical protein
MATLTVTIPSNFIQNMNQLMANVQRMQQLTNQLVQKMQATPAAQNLYRVHYAASQTHRLYNVMQKIYATLQRALDSIINSMGTVAKYFLRGLSVAAGVLGPIISAAVTITSFAISTAIFATTLTLRISRWFWDKMIGLGDSILQDYLAASGSRSTIGGLRAFRTAFGMVDDPGLLPGMVRARGDVMSPQYAALQMMKVMPQNDTTGMMVQAALGAAAFMKAQQLGQELRIANALMLTSLFNPQTLLKLKNLDDDELKLMKENYERYKPLMQITEKAAKGWINFRLQVKAAGVQIETVIVEQLANKESPFVQSLTNLSQSITRFFKIFTDKFITKEGVDTLGKWIEDFGKYLSKPETIEKIEKLIETIKDIVKSVFEAIMYLKQMIEIWGGKTPVELRGGGRRVLARQLRIERPSGAPSVTGPAPIARYPGRQRFHEKIGIERKPYEPRISPRPGAEPEAPTRLRAPTKPEEAPETAQEAVKGGYVRGGGIIDRSQFVNEMRDKPWLRQRAMEIAANEEGTNPHGTQMIIESAMNRAQVRGTSLEKQLRWTSEGGYYDDARGHGRAVATAASPQGKAILGRSVDNALGGSNAAEYATDNSSGGMAEREARSGKFKFIKKTPQGDTMFSPGSAEPNLIPKFDAWKKKQAGRGGGVGGYTVQDIKEMDGTTPPAAREAPVGPVQKTGPGTWSDLPKRQGHDPELRTVDPRLREILSASRNQFEKAHPGYRVLASSGRRTTAGPHSSQTGAIDMIIVDPQGHEISNKGDDPTGLYHEYARHSYGEMQARYPELKGRFAWGGAFGTQLGGGGPPDLMHFDLSGDRGHWTQNRMGNLGPMPGVLYGKTPSVGPDQQTQAPADPKTPWPQYKPEPWPEEDHPINKVKVHNHSDEDVSEAKSSSDNDSGKSTPAEDLAEGTAPV